MVEITTELLNENLVRLTHSPYIHGLFILIMVDILTGYAKGLRLKKFDTKVSVNGLIRHAIVMGIIITIGVYARSLGYPNISISACLFMMGNYAISVAENWEALGLPFPQTIKPFFAQMKEKTEKNLSEEIRKGK